MERPLISVCVPTYNGAAFLEEALDSIYHQTYPNIEVVVSDDESVDATCKLVQNYINKVNYPVKILSHKPMGIGANWNNCLRHANGKYIKFLFQDDVMLPNCITEMVEVLEKDDSIGMVASKRGFIFEDINERTEYAEWLKTYEDLQKYLELDYIPYGIIDKSFFKSSQFCKPPVNIVGEPSVVMFRTSLLSKIGYFNEDLIQFLDFEYWFRILKISKIIIINKKLVNFRIHKDQATRQNVGRIREDVVYIDKLLYRDYFWLLNKPLQRKLFFKFNFIGKLLNYLRK